MAEDAGESKAAELLSRIQSTDDFYKILGVERDADDDTIKKAYRKAALRLHPDKCQLEGAKEAFQKVSTAFGCLSEADERAYYDRTGRERSAAAVGQHAADPDEIFRQFFGEDFDLNAGGGGVRFQTFGGGQGFTFVNLGGGGFPMGGGGAGAAGEGQQAGGAGVAERMLPWPLGAIVGALPPQLVVLGVVWLLFWGFAWFIANLIYFLPGANTSLNALPPHHHHPPHTHTHTHTNTTRNVSLPVPH